MNKETTPEALGNYLAPGPTERLAEMSTHYVGSRLTEKVIAYTRVNLPEGFQAQFQGFIAEGYLPFIVANHASHADGAAISKLTRYLTKKARLEMNPGEEFNGFNLPMAKSLLTGHQGWKLRVFLNYARPSLERNGLSPLPLVREKDEEKYGMPTDPRQYLRSLRSRVETGYGGVMLFPEGTTESGKRDSEGKLKGMQPFEPDSISSHAGRVRKYSGKRIMIIPVGITGGADVIDSNAKSVPLSSFARIGNLDMFHLNVGEIIREDAPELATLSSSEVDDFMGIRIANLLPPEMRGVYK